MSGDHFYATPSFHFVSERYNVSDDQQHSLGSSIPLCSPSPSISTQNPYLFHQHGSLPTIHPQLLADSSLPPSTADAIESPRSLPTESETERYLRRAFNITDSRPLNLYVLPDPPFGPHLRKPHTTELIQLAIWGSEGHRATLKEICAAVKERYPSYATMKPWQNTVRHTLSLKAMFVRLQRPPDARGKGWYWALDVSKGDENVEHRMYHNRHDVVSRARGVREGSQPSMPSGSRPTSRVRGRDSNARLHAVHAPDAPLPDVHMDEFGLFSGVQTHSLQMADLLSTWMSDSPTYTSNFEHGSTIWYGPFDNQP